MVLARYLYCKVIIFSFPICYSLEVTVQAIHGVGGEGVYKDYLGFLCKEMLPLLSEGVKWIAFASRQLTSNENIFTGIVVSSGIP